MADEVQELMEKFYANRDYTGVATVRALCMLMVLIKDQEQPLELKFDVIKTVLECFASGSQYGVISRLKEGREKFPDIPLHYALEVWEMKLAKQEAKTLDRLAVLLTAFKGFKGMDVEEELNKSKEAAAARELARK